MSKIKTIKDVNDALVLLVDEDRDLALAHKTVCDAGLQVPLRLRPGGFAGLAQIVVSQLVSKASANAIYQRFEQHISPLTPAAYLEAGTGVWQKIGLSRPKQATFSAISTAIISGKLDLESLGQLCPEEAKAHLTAIKGIGPWTAQVYLLFCMGHSDIFPSGDLALREAARLIWSMESRPTDKELAAIARKWSPRRAVAARLLWAYYAARKNGTQAAP